MKTCLQETTSERLGLEEDGEGNYGNSEFDFKNDIFFFFSNCVRMKITINF